MLKNKGKVSLVYMLDRITGCADRILEKADKVDNNDLEYLHDFNMMMIKENAELIKDWAKLAKYEVEG